MGKYPHTDVNQLHSIPVPRFIEILRIIMLNKGLIYTFDQLSELIRSGITEEDILTVLLILNLENIIDFDGDTYKILKEGHKLQNWFDNFFDFQLKMETSASLLNFSWSIENNKVKFYANNEEYEYEFSQFVIIDYPTFNLRELCK